MSVGEGGDESRWFSIRRARHPWWCTKVCLGMRGTVSSKNLSTEHKIKLVEIITIHSAGFPQGLEGLVNPHRHILLHATGAANAVPHSF